MTTKHTIEEDPAYRQFIAEATETIIELNRRFSEVANKETTFCGAGCSTCCHQIFYVTSIELEVIRNRIANNPELRKRFAETSALRQQLTAVHLEKIKEISQIKDTHEFILEWIKLKIPCALLYEDKCMIYDVRPKSCATYLTLSPPRVCAIDPRGYAPKGMKPVNLAFVEAMRGLYAKYQFPQDVLFDVSWHLDQCLNPPHEEKKKRGKKS